MTFLSFLAKISNLRPILRAKHIYEPILMIYAMGNVALEGTLEEF